MNNEINIKFNKAIGLLEDCLPLINNNIKGVDLVSKKGLISLCIELLDEVSISVEEDEVNRAFEDLFK